MYRLLQGDVGSGKTLVAAETAIIAIENGYQVAVLAPTEILATQHYFSFPRHVQETRLRRDSAYRVGIETREAAIEEAAGGGTGADRHRHSRADRGEVEFERLGLAIIDEQHRFGVEQRLKFVEKGANPDVLVMTATPIPRTLALTVYGDLDVSIIDELPPGRKPIVTKNVTEERIEQVYSFLKKQVDAGPAGVRSLPRDRGIGDAGGQGGGEDVRAVLDGGAARLSIGLLHGRMTPDDKEDVMAQFKSGDLQILVSTTVIEVGVDVPNATVMVIEQAERFGLSQLHQLRGRVGRGGDQSYCILVTAKLNDTGRERIRTMVESNDGFHIAEMDMRLRGPGEFFGTKQSGLPALRIGNILRDSEILHVARAEAEAFVEHPPSESELRRAVAYIRDHWQRRYGLVEVG